MEQIIQIARWVKPRETSQLKVLKTEVENVTERKVGKITEKKQEIFKPWMTTVPVYTWLIMKPAFKIKTVILVKIYFNVVNTNE